MPSSRSSQTHDEIPHEKPLDNVSIYVIVDPHREAPNGAHHAARVAKHLKDQLEKVVADAAPTGVRSQYVALQDELKRASEQIDPNAILAIKVLVRGDWGDAKHFREYHASPPLPRTA